MQGITRFPGGCSHQIPSVSGPALLLLYHTGAQFVKPIFGRMQDAGRCSKNKTNGSALVALAPQAHLFGIGNQLLAEIRVGNIDQGFGALPGSQTLQAGNTVLSH